jgi:hypothetical protein
MKPYCNSLVMAVLLLMLTGCASLLPSSKITIQSPWKDFDGAKLAYEKIAPGVTTVDDLRKLGFDPFLLPNIRVMNVTEVINLFLPNPSIRIEDLDPGIQKCILSKDRCTAYQIQPGITNVNRIGNFWLDLFTFKRHSVNTGWEFRGLITIVDDLVTYKDPPGGRPLIHTEQVDIKPLGPAQEIGAAIISVIPTLRP